MDWSQVLRLPQPTEHYGFVLDQLLSNESSSFQPGKSRWTENDELEANSCPGCCDSFLLPTTFFQHIYRRSVRIRFECPRCCKYLEFTNKCLFRIHLLSHWELGGERLEADLLELSSLETSELNISSTKVTNNSCQASLRRTMSQLARSETEAQCMECLQILPSQEALRQHIQPALDPMAAAALDPQLLCQLCQRFSPSACSLRAHGRVHTKRPPYVCPECGDEFLTWTIFKMHLARTCLHDARTLCYYCPCCPLPPAGDVMLLLPYHSQSVPAALVDHLLDQHIRTAWKCSHCSRAFALKEKLRGHARVAHKARVFIFH
jgi:hypothetical protein